jgi:hypothetical protein
VACKNILQASGIITQPQEEEKERGTGIPPFLTDAYGVAEVLQFSKHFYLFFGQVIHQNHSTKTQDKPNFNCLVKMIQI